MAEWWVRSLSFQARLEQMALPTVCDPSGRGNRRYYIAIVMTRKLEEKYTIFGSHLFLFGFALLLLLLLLLLCLFFFLSFFLSLSLSLSLSLFLSFFLMYLFIVYIWVSCLHAHQKREPNSIAEHCEPPCGCWELNSGHLEEQSVLLTPEPSLQSPILVFINMPNC